MILYQLARFLLNLFHVHYVFDISAISLLVLPKDFELIEKVLLFWVDFTYMAMEMVVDCPLVRV